MLVLSVCRVVAASDSVILISVPDQKLVLMQNGVRVAEYPVSTSRYGVGDRFGSYATPVGRMEVATKIGEGIAVAGTPLLLLPPY